MNESHAVTQNLVDFVEKTAWFYELAEELKGIITESVFNSRWELISGYHRVGKMIVEKEAEFPKGIDSIGAISKAVGQSRKTILRCVLFAKKFPDLDALPGGKNISWHRLVNEFLPENKKPKLDKDAKLEAKIWQFISDFYIAERKSRKEFLVEGIKEWEFNKKK